MYGGREVINEFIDDIWMLSLSVLVDTQKG